MLRLSFRSAFPRIAHAGQSARGAPDVCPSSSCPCAYRATRLWQRAHSRLVFQGLTRLVMIPSFHALYFAYLKMRPFIQKARLVFPRWLYLPLVGLRSPKCSNTKMLACCACANWTMRVLT